MAETTQTTRAQRTAMPAQQFKEDIATLKRDIGNLITLAAQIAREGSVTVTLPGQKEPVTFGAQSIKSFRSQINKKLTAISSEYSLAIRGRRAKRATGRAGGLPNLSLISDSYRRFWAEANLGPLDPRNFSIEDIAAGNFPDDQAVVGQLPLLTEQAITSSSLLQSAWATYIDVNGLRNTPNYTQDELNALLQEDVYRNMTRDEALKAINALPQYSGLYLHVDRHIEDSLGPALDWLEQNTPTVEQQARYQAKLDANTDPKKTFDEPEKFDRNAFKRYWLATIGSFYTVPRPGAPASPAQIAVGNDVAMTQEQETNLRQEATRRDVQAEIAVLKDVRDKWNRKLQTGAYAPKKAGRGGKKVAKPEEAELDEFQEEQERELDQALGEEEEPEEEIEEEEPEEEN